MRVIFLIAVFFVSICMNIYLYSKSESQKEIIFLLREQVDLRKEISKSDNTLANITAAETLKCWKVLEITAKRLGIQDRDSLVTSAWKFGIGGE